MARAVAAGHILEPDLNVFEPMPSLPPKILVRYQNAHSSGGNPLRHFEDCNSTIHGGRSERKRADNDTINNPDEGEPTTGQSTAGQSAVDEPSMDQSTMNQAITNQSSEDELSEDESDHDESDHLAIASLKSESDDNKPTQGRSDEQIQIFRHLPRHDAESVFWVIVVFLLRALPLGQPPEKDKNTKSLISSWKCIASHEIMSSPAGIPIDFRTMLLSPKNWETNLHEKLGGLVPMMKELVVQVRPEYSHLAEPPPDEFHLHEAMQRILLRYAVKFSEASDIFLNAEKGRIVLEKKDYPEQRASTNISLDGQHFQRAGHRSHFSVSQGSDSIVVDKSEWTPAFSGIPADPLDCRKAEGQHRSKFL